MDPDHEIEKRCEAASKRVIAKARARRQALIAAHEEKHGLPAAEPVPPPVAVPDPECKAPSVAARARAIVADNPEATFTTLVQHLVQTGVKATTARGAIVRALSAVRGAP